MPHTETVLEEITRLDIATSAGIEHLAKAANLGAENFFTLEARMSKPLADREVEGLGIMVSKFAEWNGITIMRTFSAALSDANFHREAEIVEMLISYREESR